MTSQDLFSKPFPALLVPKRSFSVLVGDSIPPSIGSLPALEDLDLSNNHLPGPLPPEIGRLRSLLSIDVSSNGLRLGLPGSICDLTRLSALTLKCNAFTGSMRRVSETWRR